MKKYLYVCIVKTFTLLVPPKVNDCISHHSLLKISLLGSRLVSLPHVLKLDASAIS